MKYVKFSFLPALICLIMASAAMSLAVSESSARSAPSRLSVNKRVLDNGLTVLVKPDYSNPLVSIEVVIKTGSLYEGLWQGSGIAHLVEHMIFKGSRDLPREKLESEVRRLGGMINGYTSYELTGYTLVLPSQYLDEGLKLLKTVIIDPAFDSTELEKEKQVILNEIRLNRDDPGRYLSRLFWRNAYINEPYNLPIIGVESSFLTLAEDDLKKFHQKWYVANNIIVAVAGDVDSAEAVQKIDTVFGAVPAAFYPSRQLPAPETVPASKSHVEDFDLNSTRMMFGFPGVSLTDSDAPGLDILAVILAHGQTSRLYKSLVKENRLLETVDAFNYTPQFPGLFVISCRLEPQNIDKALEAFFLQIEQLKRGKISRAELEKARKVYAGDYILNRQSLESQTRRMVTDEVFAGTPEFSQQYLERLNTVSISDIRRCAKRYFNPDRLVKVVLNPASVSKNIETIPEKPEMPIIRTVIPAGPTVLFRNVPDAGMVSLQAVLPGGTRRETIGDNGLFNLLSIMLTRGTRSRSAAEIAEAVESMGGQLEPFSGYNSYGIRMNLLSGDLMKGLELFSDLLLNPVFSESELEFEKQLAKKRIKSENDDIFRHTINILKKNLFLSGPYKLNILGTSDSVSAFSRTQLQKAQQRFFRPEDMVISVFGEVEDADKAVSLLEKKFKRPGVSPPRKVESEIETAVVDAPVFLRNNRDKAQAVVMIGFPGVSLQHPDRYALEFACELLAGSGSVLYRKIREERGLAYTLGGSSISGPDTGFAFIYAATDPEEAGRVRELIEAEIARLRQEPVSQELLLQTGNYLIGRTRISRQTPASFGFSAALDELLGLGFEHYQTYERRIAELGPKEVQAVFKRYFDPARCAVIITGPDV